MKIWRKIGQTSIFKKLQICKKPGPESTLIDASDLKDEI